MRSFLTTERSVWGVHATTRSCYRRTYTGRAPQLGNLVLSLVQFSSSRSLYYLGGIIHRRVSEFLTNYRVLRNIQTAVQHNLDLKNARDKPFGSEKGSAFVSVDNTC